MNRSSATAPSRNGALARSLVGPVTRAVRMNASAAVRSRLRSTAALAGAHLTSYDPLDQATAAAPHAAYRALHAEGRVHYNPRRHMWILHRFDDVRAGALAADKLISGEGVTLQRFPLPILPTSDGRAHSELRRQVIPSFSKANLESWRPLIDQLATDMVDDLLGNPGGDAVRRLAQPLPMRVIAHMLGVPAADMDAFRSWSASASGSLDFELSRRGVRKVRDFRDGIFSLWRYFNHKLDDGALQAPGTVLGRMLDASGEQPPERVDLFAMMVVLIVAGNETTTNLLGDMFITFARAPEQYEMIRASPDLTSGAVEEQLRMTSPVQMLFRTAAEPYPVGEATIPAGDRVMLQFAAANRDPLTFTDPDTFRADRDVRTHLGFGFGAHLCLGASLARLETQAVLRALVQRVSGIELTADPLWSTNSSLRGPTSVAVRLTPA